MRPLALADLGDDPQPGDAPPPAGERALELPELDAGPAPGAAAPPSRTPRDEAFERGFAEGLEEGAARAQHRVRTALDALGRVGESLHAMQSALLRDRSRDLHALALAIARKLVGREVAADPALVGQWVTGALELVPPDSRCEVRLHPDDLASFAGDLPKGGGEGEPSIRWVGDPTLERGEFLVEGPHRIVDGRTDFALRALYERLGHE
ncbi:MAG TPA: FliH/SctL family protein [Terriglobales bacterium]|nr:FliH/SctL family protein [Terriglobales bacterium]